MSQVIEKSTIDNIKKVNAILINLKEKEKWGWFLCQWLCFQCDSSRKICKGECSVVLCVTVIEVIRNFLTAKPFLKKFQQHYPYQYICQRKSEVCPSGYIYRNLDLKFHFLKQIGKIQFPEKFITLSYYSGLQHNSLQLCEMNSGLSSRKVLLFG